METFDPYSYLQECVGKPINREELTVLIISQVTCSFSPNSEAIATIHFVCLTISCDCLITSPEHGCSA